MSHFKSSNPTSPVAVWIKAIRMTGMNPGSRRSRGCLWWSERASEFFGRAVSEAEFRAAALEAGVRIGPDGDKTDMLAGDSMIRALRTFPARYELQPDGRVTIRAGSSAPDADRGAK